MSSPTLPYATPPSDTRLRTACVIVMYICGVEFFFLGFGPTLVFFIALLFSGPGYWPIEFAFGLPYFCVGLIGLSMWKHVLSIQLGKPEAAASASRTIRKFAALATFCMLPLFALELLPRNEATDLIQLAILALAVLAGIPVLATHTLLSRLSRAESSWFDSSSPT